METDRERAQSELKATYVSTDVILHHLVCMGLNCTECTCY